MTPLPNPVRGVLKQPLDDLSVQRVWQRVRRARRAPQRGLGRVVFAAAALGVMTLLVLFLIRRVPASEALLIDGHEVTTLEGNADGAPRLVTLSDASTIELWPGTVLETLENRGNAFALHLKLGRAHFEVMPGGPRRWTVECGVLTVEVVGTGFTIERSAEETRVLVGHGVVIVRGERVPDRVARLTDGMSIVVAEEIKDTRTVIAPSGSAVAPPLPSAELPHAITGTSEAPSWRTMAARGEYKNAYEELGPGGIRETATQANIDDLLALADVARLSGHPADAVLPLQRAAETGDSRASLAAFTLGRLELDRLGNPAAAAIAFEEAVRLGLPSGLSEDALARLVEAHARAGDHEGAAAALGRFEEKFPSSARIPALRKWVTPE